MAGHRPACITSQSPITCRSFDSLCGDSVSLFYEKKSFKNKRVGYNQ